MVDCVVFIRLMVGSVFHCDERHSKFRKGILKPFMCQLFSVKYFS